jgi:hypothetical protein
VMMEIDSNVSLSYVMRSPLTEEYGIK